MMSALLDFVQQLLIRRSFEPWREVKRDTRAYSPVPIAEWHQRLDVLEARLAERSRKRLDAESARVEEPAHAQLDDAT